jgi:hypothetical protein
MKIYNKIVYDFNNNIIEEDYYEYNGPLTLANAAGAASTGGSPKQMSKDKVKKDKEEKEMTEEFNEIDKDIEKDKTTTPKDIERDNEKVKVPKNKPDFKSVTKEVLNPNNNVQEKKKITTTNIGNDGNDGENNNQVKVTEPVILKKNIGGTTVQTTEAKVAEDKKKSEEEYDARITKKKGRIKNILTSSTGVTQTSSNYSLGKPTLLGMV